MGDMNWHAHSGIFTAPFIVAVKYNIPLLFYGEHGFMDLGGMHSYDDYVEFTQRYRLEHLQRGYDWHDMIGDKDEPIEKREMLNYIFPKDEDIRRVGVRGIFISNYVKWSGNDNAIIAKKYEEYTQWDLVFKHENLNKEIVKELVNKVYAKYYFSLFVLVVFFFTYFYVLVFHKLINFVSGV